VMLALALETDAAQRHHLVIALDLVEGLLQSLDRVLSVADEGLFKCARHPRRRLDQAGAIGIIAAPPDNRPHGGFDLGSVRLATMMQSPYRFQRKNIGAHDKASLLRGKEPRRLSWT